MKTDLTQKTTAELEAQANAGFRNYLEFLIEDCREQSITMTQATESIFGTSGRGNRTAVRIIEKLAQYGFVTITGDKKRRVQVSDKGFDFFHNETLSAFNS